MNEDLIREMFGGTHDLSDHVKQKSKLLMDDSDQSHSTSKCVGERVDEQQ
jgi:hypothetical protein